MAVSFQACVLCAVAVLAGTSVREARAEVLVLDTCVIECDADDRRLLGAFRRLLATEYVRPNLATTPSAVLEAIGDGVPWPAAIDPGMTARKIIDDLKSGIEHWVNGRYEQAARQLEEGLGAAKHNPELVASEPTLRQLIPRAHVGRAVSLWRLRRRALAKEAMAELARTLPEPSILDSWGTEADQIFQLARKELGALGKGSLVVEVDDPSTIFYVNEAGQPHRSLFAAALYPGTYRIFVQDARGQSRRFHATVEPNDVAMLRIQWRRETRFSASGDHVGFVFESAAERTSESAYARHFASLAKADLIVVVGRIRWRKRAAMIGTIYSVESGSAYRVGVVPLADDESRAVRGLATFLLSPSQPAPGVTTLAAPPWEAATSDAPPPVLGIQYPLGWALSGGALAAGAVLIAIVDDEHARRGPTGYVLVGIGVAVGVATTLFYLRRGGAPRAMAAVVPTSSDRGLLAWTVWRF